MSVCLVGPHKAESTRREGNGRGEFLQRGDGEWGQGNAPGKKLGTASFRSGRAQLSAQRLLSPKEGEGCDGVALPPFPHVAIFLFFLPRGGYPPMGD